MGTYCPVGSAAETNCAAGTFNNQPAQEVCVKCDRGTYQDSEGATACVECVAGRASDPTNSECDVCPPGRYSSDGVTCSFCPPGEEPNTVEFSVGATHCIECLNGTHRHSDCTNGSLVQASNPTALL